MPISLPSVCGHLGAGRCMNPSRCFHQNPHFDQSRCQRSRPSRHTRIYKVRAPEERGTKGCIVYVGVSEEMSRIDSYSTLISKVVTDNLRYDPSLFSTSVVWCLSLCVFLCLYSRACMGQGGMGLRAWAGQMQQPQPQARRRSPDGREIDCEREAHEYIFPPSFCSDRRII